MHRASCISIESMTYQEAITRLEAITAQLSSGNTDVDSLVSLLTEAKQLIALCRQRLTQVETEVNNLLDDGQATPVRD